MTNDFYLGWCCGIIGTTLGRSCWLIARATSGEEYFQEILSATLLLVISIATAYVGYSFAVRNTPSERK